MKTMRLICLSAAITAILAGSMPARNSLASPDPVVGGGAAIGGFRPRPAPPEGFDYQWIPPVYKTVIEQVWVAGRVEMIPDWIEIRPGRWEQIWRQVATPGHWQSTTHQVVIAQGYLCLVRITPPPIFSPPPFVLHPIIPRPGIARIEGYAPIQSEDLSAFSPLSEWPESR